MGTAQAREAQSFRCGARKGVLGILPPGPQPSSARFLPEEKTEHGMGAPPKTGGMCALSGKSPQPFPCCGTSVFRIAPEVVPVRRKNRPGGRVDASVLRGQTAERPFPAGVTQHAGNDATGLALPLGEGGKT